jgi:MEDS: MEthanogen/methylotroph, DcmR Sensory domain
LREHDELGRSDNMSTTLVDALGRIETGGHICSLYASSEEQFASAIPFTRIGLEKGERCMYVAELECDLEAVQFNLAGFVSCHD